MQSGQHWEQVYTTRDATSVSWFQEHARQSMALIRRSKLGSGDAIIDVGGGASTLVDDLLDAGYSNVTILDLSAAALAASRGRLGERARQVTWQVGDVTQLGLPRHAYALWHDRAVFHFLTTVDEREAYVRAVLRAVRPGGHVIVATFAENGPEKCSGLPVVRYSPERLHAEFGAPFTLLGQTRESHHTPAGAVQKFIYCWCRRESHSGDTPGGGPHSMAASVGSAADLREAARGRSCRWAACP